MHLAIIIKEGFVDLPGKEADHPGGVLNKSVLTQERGGRKR
jgi:hypothetical protein